MSPMTAAGRTWGGSGTGGAVAGRMSLEPLQQLLEAAAILGEIDGVGRSAEDGDLCRFERGGEFERRLPAELDDDAEHRAAPLLDAHQLDHVLRRHRLEIKPVGGVRTASAAAVRPPRPLAGPGGPARAPAPPPRRCGGSPRGTTGRICKRRGSPRW